ncbi:CotH kinase family protein [Candidatus Saccharibacteria bacterium]|nr:CotH kinase family protein [Candidatus Saccharibacteria bacterium]
MKKYIPLFVFPILAVFLSLFLFLSNRPIENKTAKSIDTDDTYCKQKDVSERAKCLFNIDKIEKLELTSKEPLDLTYHKSNKGIEVSLDGNSLPTAKLKTRGNTTYQAGTIYGAYNYKLTFEEPVNLYNFGTNKKWVLLPNLIDRSYFRQFYFSNLGQLIMSDFWSPQMKYIELYINEEYKGLYLLSESIEEDENRLNSPEYIVQMEQGRLWRLEKGSDKDYFQIDDKSLSCNIDPTAKDIEPTNTMYTLEYPDSFEKAGEEKANMIKSEINDLVNNARDGKPLDKLNLDLDSAVNFYLFDELFYNSGFGSSSVYFYRPEDSKIVLGPLWDFDQLALQDYPENFNRPITCDNNLYRYLLKYPEFRDKLKEKLTWFKDNLSELSLNIIEEMRNNEILKTAVEKNENLYHTWENPMKDLSVWQNDKIWRLKNWDEHLDYIKRFMDGRVDWLLEHFDDLK